MISYLMIGFGVYLAAAVMRFDTLMDHGLFPVLKGILFGVLLWPVALIVLYHTRND